MNKIPTEVHLYWVTLSGGQTGGYFTLHHTDSMKDYQNYNWLGMAPVDFGDVEFDEQSLKLKALNCELGEAQGKVNYIKERIQELLAIGHDVEHEPVLKDIPVFDDDVGF
jgi:hypothetical protein